MTPPRLGAGTRRAALAALIGQAALAPLAVHARPVVAEQEQTPVRAAPQGSVRDALAALRYPELRFTPVQAQVASVRGVPVYYVQDRELPLVTFYATFRGGIRRLPRDYFAAASALPGLLRAGGTASLPPDSVDDRIESLALSMSFGQGGESASAWVNSLSEHAETAVSLWSEMLRLPRFDSAQVEQWRGAELERVRRRGDDPGALAFGLFNHIMYGDHPVGWQMTPEDLEPADLAPDKLRFVHRAVVCPGAMSVGVVGDVGRAQALDLVDRMLEDWPPCSGDLGDDPAPRIRAEPGVFVLHKAIEQSVVVLAHSSALRQEDAPAYFASRVANSIFGASGLSSRLSAVLRTREGLAYGAASVWTAPRKHDGLVGALTRTRPGATLAAARLLLDVVDSMRTTPPAPREVALAIDEAANGFVFNFQTPFQVVARRMALDNMELPEDWMERYLVGVRDVTPERVQQVFRRHVDPSRMTILLVGDTTRFDGSPSELGTVTVLPSPQSEAPRSLPSGTASRPRESRRSEGAPRRPRGPESPSPTRAGTSRPTDGRTRASQPRAGRARSRAGRPRPRACRAAT